MHVLHRIDFDTTPFSRFDHIRTSHVNETCIQEAATDSKPADLEEDPSGNPGFTHGGEGERDADQAKLEVWPMRSFPLMQVQLLFSASDIV